MKYERELWEKNGFTIIVLSLVSASDGVLGPRCAHAWPSTQPPIDTGRNFSAQMSSGKKNSKNFWSIFSPFQQILSTFRVFTKKKSKSGQGCPQNLFSPQFLFLCALKPHEKFQNPR